MKKCNRCNEYSLHEECYCRLFKIEDEDGEIHEIYTNGTEHSAALKYAEKSNIDHEYYLVDNSVEIKVNGKKFVISAEPDIHYGAEETV